MKKIYFVLLATMFLASSCNSFSLVPQQKPNTQNQISAPEQCSNPIELYPDWAVYTNPRLGYSFQYPTNMEAVDWVSYDPNANTVEGRWSSRSPNKDLVRLETITGNNPFRPLETIPEGSHVYPYEVDPNQYWVAAYLENGQITLEQWIQDNSLYAVEAKTRTLSPPKKMILDGRKAYRLDFPGGAEIVTMVNRAVYDISAAAPESSHNDFEYYSTLDHLLASFKIK